MNENKNLPNKYFVLTAITEAEKIEAIVQEIILVH